MTKFYVARVRYVYNVKLVKIHDNIKINFTILKLKIT